MDRPNVLFLLIDDLGCRDLTCYGSTFYETPHLDRLARQGMLFTNAYASCPVCSPTRASVLTGKYPARVGITHYIPGGGRGRLRLVPYLHHLPLSEKSIARALGDHGYATWHIGKWHLGEAPYDPVSHGFDVNIGGCGAGSPGSGGYFSPWSIPALAGIDAPDGTYLTDYLTDRAIELIKNRGERPFFMHFSHYAVHTPLQAPEELVAKYRRKARRMKLDQVQAVVEGDYFPCVHRQDKRIQRRVVQSHPVYAAMVENLDANIGRLLGALEEEGLAENTLVVFTSDNGGLATSEGSPTSNLPYAEGKGWNSEGGTRVCQIARWPRTVAPRTVCPVPVTTTDFYPTFLEATGAELIPEQHCDGVSLMPLLKGADALDREALFWHYPHYSNQGGTPAASIVSGDWKLIEYFEDGALELYNLRDDPSESRDLSSALPARATELREALACWRHDVGAVIPETDPDYRPPER